MTGKAADQPRGALRADRQAVHRPARRGRRAQLAADELQPGRPAWSTSPPTTPRFPYLADEGLEAERHRLPDRARHRARPRCRPINGSARAAHRQPTTGALVAWDPVAQKEAWRVDLPRPVERRHAGDRGQPGVPGHRARAISSPTTPTAGGKLWSFPAQTGIDRRADDLCHRRRAVRRGARRLGRGVGHRAGHPRRQVRPGPRNISRLLVFKLGGTAQAAARRRRSASCVLDPPAFTGTAAQVARGGGLYGALLLGLPRRCGGRRRAQPRPAPFGRDRRSPTRSSRS